MFPIMALIGKAPNLIVSGVETVYSWITQCLWKFLIQNYQVLQKMIYVYAWNRMAP